MLVTLIFFVCLALILALNVFASRAILQDDLVSAGQRVGQLIFVWCLPVIGALLALHLKRALPEKSSGQYPQDPDIGDDFGGAVGGRSKTAKISSEPDTDTDD